MSVRGREAESARLKILCLVLNIDGSNPSGRIL